MSTSAQRSARTALDAARPAMARLDDNRGAEDVAADLIDIWGAAESALRTLVGSSTLSGQSLIREARQRQAIGFDQANALAEFEAVHARLQDTSYKPSASDITSARSAFSKLDAALLDDAAASATRGAPFGTSAPQGGVVNTGTVPVAQTEPAAVVSRRGIPGWAKAVAAAVVVLAIGGVAYAVLSPRGTSSSLQQGIDAYAAGQREVAANAFNRAVREDPRNPMPHVYIARMAREVGNFSLATQELQLALQDDPADPAALREMGANLLAQGNFELARRFYVRAVEANPNDKSAQGYLGCTLMRLGRTQEAANFINRAGAGPWSTCTPAGPNGQAAGQLAPLTGAVTPGTIARP